MPSLRFRIAEFLLTFSRLVQMESFSSVSYQRWWFDVVVPRLSFTVKGVDLRREEVSGIKAEWAVPEGEDEGRAVLYLHGGAYVVGSAGSHRTLVSRLAQEAGCRALSVEYRLAPEHPFPAAVEDAVKAYQWLLDRGYEAGSLAIAGDSAGGGLAVAAMLSMRGKGIPLPAAAFHLSPWTDLEVKGESVGKVGWRDPMLSARALRREAAMYLAGRDPRDPLASSIYADLSGLPPMLIQVGTREILLDDAVRLVERAEEAGVAVELDVWPGMFHVWQFFATLVPESDAALEKAGRFLRRNTEGERNRGGDSL